MIYIYNNKTYLFESEKDIMKFIERIEEENK